MKGFQRKNRRLSLCGLNCGLCPMLLGGYCGGCGNGNQSCAIARCSLERGKPEFCFECPNYPCERLTGMDEWDSFITHRHRKADLQKAKRMGIDAYDREQKEKRELLDHLLSHYNDGRRKTFFCVAVNLLELEDLRQALGKLEASGELEGKSQKESALCVVQAFQAIADERQIPLKLFRKK